MVSCLSLPIHFYSSIKITSNHSNSKYFKRKISVGIIVWFSLYIFPIFPSILIKNLVFIWAKSTHCQKSVLNENFALQLSKITFGGMNWTRRSFSNRTHFCIDQIPQDFSAKAAFSTKLSSSKYHKIRIYLLAILLHKNKRTKFSKAVNISISKKMSPVIFGFSFWMPLKKSNLDK